KIFLSFVFIIINSLKDNFLMISKNKYLSSSYINNDFKSRINKFDTGRNDILVKNKIYIVLTHKLYYLTFKM
ncbi:MAG TPA: hypothetical protein DCX03_04785, partial [Bacteroidales bacterium]|nr:hypothetical protein [Bacteroidales bacterium]